MRKNNIRSGFFLFENGDAGTGRKIKVGSRDAGDGDANVETGPGAGTEILKRDASHPPLTGTLEPQKKWGSGTGGTRNAKSWNAFRRCVPPVPKYFF